MPTKRNQVFMDLQHPGNKKASKPLMEKRRRARINHCLAQLKALVVDPNTTERSRQAKLEKADILELTVRHLHDIKRRQRILSLSNARHPKRKFEIGYAECVREVELFLSNLLDPQLVGLEGDLQRRLKNHLCRRLQDLQNIEPFANNKRESSDEECSASRSNSMFTSSSDLHSENAPSDDMNSEMKDSQPSENYTFEESEKKTPQLNELDLVINNQYTSNSTTEEENSLPLCSQPSCTYGCKPSSTPPPKLTAYQQIPEDLCFNTPSQGNYLNEQKVGVSSLERYATSKSQSAIESRTNTKKFPKHSLDARSSSAPSENFNLPLREHKEEDFSSVANAQNQHLLEQIPLVPRRLPNGDWAFVLPASLVTAENEEFYPFSAFRLVVPPGSNVTDLDHEQQRQHHTSSPLSSTVSDMSSEECCSRLDGENSERVEDYIRSNNPQFVWRPW